MSITLQFTKDKETKNKVRFEESEGKQGVVVGTLYIGKAQAAELGDKITVSIEKGHQ